MQKLLIEDADRLERESGFIQWQQKLRGPAVPKPLFWNKIIPFLTGKPSKSSMATYFGTLSERLKAILEQKIW